MRVPGAILAPDLFELTVGPVVPVDVPSPISPLEESNAKSLQDAIYNRLHAMLMRGAFQPGQKLSSRKLAAQLGTSDMPVRAVLGRLLAEGGLVQNQNGTFSVPALSLRVFREVMSLRAMLEAEATRQACGAIDRAGFQTLYTCIDGMTKAMEAQDAQTYFDLNQKLKFTIYHYASSQTLKSMIGLLWLQAGPFLRHLKKDFSKNRGGTFYIEVVDALANGDREAAAEAVSKDILTAMAFLTLHGNFGSE